MIQHNHFMERIGWVTAFWAMVCLGLMLSGVKVEAQINCRIVTKAYPAMQMSFVSKQCWKQPDQVIEVAPSAVLPIIIPKPKPLIQAASVKKAGKRSRACGSKRQVWRKLKNGHRKYRCVA